LSWLRRFACVLGVCCLVAFAPVSAWAASAPVGGLTCSASGEYDGGVHAAAHLCDGLTGAINGGQSWGVAGTSGWVQVQAVSPVVVTGYSIVPTTDYPESWPRAWVFSGSADGVTWTTLDTQAAQLNGVGVYAVTNSVAFSYFRWTISSNNGGALIYLSELGLSTGGTTATTPPPTGSGLPAGTDADPVIVSLPVAFYAFVIGSGSLTVFLLAASLVSRWGA
jgi:hypothetical protein